MKGSRPLKLGGVAALYLLWLVNWLVLREVAFGPRNYSWSQSLVAAVGAGVALRVSRRVAQPYPTFFLLLGVGLLLLAGSWATYDPDFKRPFLHFEGAGILSYSDVIYAGFVFTWICTWGYLIIADWQRKLPSALTGVVFAALMCGLALIFATFYPPTYYATLHTIAGRLNAVIAGLEFLTLGIGLACLLLGQPAFITWILIASAVLIASDMGYSMENVPDALQPIWLFADFLLVGILLVLPDTLTGVARDPTLLTPVGGFSQSQRSGLSGALILLSLGAVLLTVGVWLLPIPPVWKYFCSIHRGTSGDLCLDYGALR